MSAARQLEKSKEPKRGTVSGTFPRRRRDTQEQDHLSLSMRLKRMRTQDPMELTMRLLDLRSFLLRHFAREEGRGGFFELVLTNAGRYQGKIVQLRREHTEALERIDTLLTMVKRCPTELSESGIRQTAELVNLLHDHEAMENELLQDVMIDDMGVGD